MKRCPFCAEEIRDEAVKCRYCREFLDEKLTSERQMAVGPARFWWGYEYRSKAELFGWPLVHIAQGVDPKTGRPRVARGIIAIGNIAIGLVAIGGLAVGGIVVGGLGLGLVALAGIAGGALAFGGIALGLCFAVGGLAISAMYAIGGLALAPHTIGPTGADPELLRMLEKWFPGIRDSFPNADQ